MRFISPFILFKNFLKIKNNKNSEFILSPYQITKYNKLNFKKKLLIFFLCASA